MKNLPVSFKRLYSRLPNDRTVLGKIRLILFRISILVIIQAIPILSFSQQFSTQFIFKDAIGNKDTLIIGHDINSSSDYDSIYDGTNIINKLDSSGFDIRITDEYTKRLNQTNSSFHTKKKVTEYTCGDWSDFIFIDINAENWPITLYWNKQAFADTCRDGSIITNYQLNDFPDQSFDFRHELIEKDSMVLIKPNSLLNEYFGYIKETGDTIFSIGISFKKVPRNMVPIPYPANSPDKSGWNLLFSDEFSGQSIDLNKWSLSTPTDDGTGHCLDSIGNPLPYGRSLTANPNMISQANGVCKIDLTNDDHDICYHSFGEIKSFSTQPNFNAYYFSTGYIEIRAKIPFATGVGSAAWLSNCYPAYSEIDIWETHPDFEYSFYSNYHWQKGGSQYYCSPEADKYRKGKQLKHNIIDSQGDSIYLNQNWMVYGLEWNKDSIIWYLNGTTIRVIDIANDTSYNKIGPDIPLNIRFGTSFAGDVDMDDNVLPQSLFIDYIRVYKKTNKKAIEFTNIPNYSLCKTDQWGGLNGHSMACTYYPDVQYNWDSTYFSYVNDDFEWYKWAKVRPLTAGNQLYQVNLTSTFPSGYVENNSFYVYIANSIPSTPGPIFGNSCRQYLLLCC